MVKLLSYTIIMILILQFLGCEIKRDKDSSLTSKTVALPDTFDVIMLSKWNESTRRGIAVQKRECDSLLVYTQLEAFLAGFNIDENGAGERNTHRTTFFRYLTSSGVLVDSLRYDNIYIIENSISGESLYLSNTLAVVKNQTIKLYKFEYVLGEWKLIKKWESNRDDLEELFSRISCSNTNCDTAKMASGESLVISKFIQNKVEVKVIVMTCKEYLKELNSLFKLELLGL